MRKKFLLISSLAASLALAAAAIAQDKPTEDEASSAQVAVEQAAPALTVEAVSPRQETWPETVAADGWIAAWQEGVVSAEVGGQRIVSIDAGVGDTVKAGDVLATLSSDSIENEITQREATVESSRAALEEASGNGDRARKLKNSAAVTQQQITEYLVAEMKAKADLASAEASLASSRLDLEHTKILAVDDGIISLRSAELGDVVTAGAEMFRLIRQGRVEWQAEVPLRQIASIHAGTKAILPSPFGDIQGTVRTIGATASDKNGRVTIYVSLIKPGKDLPSPKTGVFASGRFEIGERKAMAVPAAAVALRDGFSYVFVISKPKNGTATVTRARVETGRRQDDRVEIVSGLSGDESIVKSGGAFLSDGSVVKVLDASDDKVASREPDLAGDGAIQ